MNTALIFISYHPGSLVDYNHLREIDNNRSLHIMTICQHPYVNTEIIALYSKNFHQTICLPDINYETNIIKGFIKYIKYLNFFNKEMRPLLKSINSFNIISDCSAYLPVNALLSKLKKHKKCKNLISIREDYSFKREINFPRTIRTRIYTFLLGLYPIYAHRVYHYMYLKEPRDKIVRLIKPYEKRPDTLHDKTMPIYFIYQPPIERSTSKKDIVIVYSDRGLDGYYDLSKEEFEKRLKIFFKALSNHYQGHKIICKPHPLDKEKVMAGLQDIEFELYYGNLTSQMHLNMNIQNVKACYSVSSTSLLYSAFQGIPSYTIYKYLEFNGMHPKKLFENGPAKENPFLYHIKTMDEIGNIDNLHVEPIKDNSTNDWDKIIT